MKRIIASIIACMSIISMSHAQDTVILKSGSLEFLNSPTGLFLEVSFENAKVGDQTIEEYLATKGDDYVRDWPDNQQTGQSFFEKEFNKRNKGGAQIRKSTAVVQPKYKMVINILNYFPGDPKMKNLPLVSKSGGDVLTGLINVYEIETGNIVCEMIIDDVNGISYPSDGERLGMALLKVAKKICILKSI